MEEINVCYTSFDERQYYDLEVYLDNPKDSLNKLIKKINTFDTINNQQLITTLSVHYKEAIKHFLRCLFRLPTYEYATYNKYLDILNKVHQWNVDFDKDFIRTEDTVKRPKGAKRKAKPKDVYIRMVTTNLFTGEPTYEYINYRRNDVIKSDNPNLLDELNANLKKQKQKQINTIGMVFKFK